MHGDGHATPSLTFNSSTLTTNGITCGSILCTGTLVKATTPTVAGVYLGFANSAAGGIEICSSSTQYVVFTITNTDYRGRLININSDSRCNWFVGASAIATPYMKLTRSGLSVSGVVV